MKDGEIVSRSMMFMDAVSFEDTGRRPGFVALSDNDATQQLAAYQRYEDQLTNRWRGEDQAEDPPPANVNVYDAYDRHLSERWKGGGQ